MKGEWVLDWRYWESKSALLKVEDECWFVTNDVNFLTRI
jgi:hypothetical protein